jgi:hypothetical protein
MLISTKFTLSLLNSRPWTLPLSTPATVSADRVKPTLSALEESHSLVLQVLFPPWLPPTSPRVLVLLGTMLCLEHVCNALLESSVLVVLLLHIPLQRLALQDRIALLE